MGLFAVLSLLMALALKQSSTLWVTSSSHQDANEVLRKISARLEKDVPMVSLEHLDIAPVPASLGGGVDGDAVWFLSHINPTTGRPHLKADGTPFWQCNVLYYSVVPESVDQLSTRPIRSGSTDGYEDRCPYKVVIRKVIDQGTPTDPNDENSEEKLMSAADISAYLSRPDRLSVAAMAGEANLLDLEIVGYPVLLFRGSPIAAPEGVQFDIRAVAIERAHRLDKGSESLLDSAATIRSELFVSAHN